MKTFLVILLLLLTTLLNTLSAFSASSSGMLMPGAFSNAQSVTIGGRVKTQNIVEIFKTLKSFSQGYNNIIVINLLDKCLENMSLLLFRNKPHNNNESVHLQFNHELYALTARKFAEDSGSFSLEALRSIMRDG